MKRRFVAIAVALMLILSVAGCAKEPLPTGSGGNGTEGGWINASFNDADIALSDTGCYHMVDFHFLYYVYNHDYPKYTLPSAKTSSSSYQILQLI